MNSIRPIIGLFWPLFLSTMPSAAQSLGERDWMGGFGWGWGNMMGGAGFAMLLFWGVIILVVVLLARGIGGFGSGGLSEPRRTPLDILKERYARGEINKQEFEQRRRAIGD